MQVSWRQKMHAQDPKCDVETITHIEYFWERLMFNGIYAYTRLNFGTWYLVSILLKYAQ